MISNRMIEIANGDLTGEELQTIRKDEFGTLVQAVNDMTKQLKFILGSIHSVSESVASNSEELSQSADEIK